MKKLIFFLFTICFSNIVLFADDEWQQFKYFNGVLLTDLNGIGMDSTNNIYFVAAQSFFKKDVNNNFYEISDKINYNENYYNVNGNMHYIQSKGIVLGTGENGFLQFDIAENKTTFFNRKDIKGDWDYSFMTGMTLENNNIWFTSRVPYLSRFDGEDFLDFDISYENKIINLPLLRTCIFYDDKENIWVAGNDGALKFSTESTLENFIYEKYSLTDMKFKDTIKNTLRQLIRIDSVIWATSNFGELSYFSDNQWHSYSIPDTMKSVPYVNDALNWLNLLAKDKDNNLILFWRSANFFLVMDSNKELRKIPFPESIMAGTNSIYVNSFIEDNFGNYWLGTLDMGLVKYSAKTSTVTENYNEVNNLLPNVYIRNVYPNPTTGRVKAELLIYPEHLNELNISLYSYLGNKVLDLTNEVEIDMRSGESRLDFDVSSLENGLYFLSISKGKVRKIKSIIKY